MIRPVDLLELREKKENSLVQAWDVWIKIWGKKTVLGKRDVEFIFVYVNIEVFVKYGFNPPTTSLHFPWYR